MNVSLPPPHPAPRLRLTGALPPSRPPLFFWGVLAPLSVGILPTFSHPSGIFRVSRWVFRWVGQFGGARGRALGARFPSAQPAPPCPFAGACAVLARSAVGLHSFFASPCSCPPAVARSAWCISAGSPSSLPWFRAWHQKRPPIGSLFLRVGASSKFKKGVQWQLQGIGNVLHGCYGGIVLAVLNT